MLPVTNSDAYFGSTMFSKKWLPAIPETLIVRERERMGVARYRCGAGHSEALSQARRQYRINKQKSTSEMYRFTK